MFNFAISKRFFYVLAKVHLILGTLISVYSAYDKGRTMINEYYNVYERDLWSTITIFTTSFYKVIIVFAFLYALYMIFTYLEYFYLKSESKVSSVDMLNNEFKEKKWRCEECGKLNDGYRSICICGNTKTE